MKIRRLILALSSLFIGLGQQLVAVELSATQTKVTKPGYKVIVEISFDETGAGEEAKVVESDDPTNDTILNRIALALSAEIKQPPHMKDGKPAKFVARVPYDFPVEGDEGKAANDAPRPSQKDGTRPVYPENLAKEGVVGGAILELNIGEDGKVQKVTVLDSSHPEFAQSAETSAKTWVFSPALKDGKPVECRWRTALAYSVDGKDVDWKWRVAPRPNLGGSIVFTRTNTAPANTPAAPAATPETPAEKPVTK